MLGRKIVRPLVMTSFFALLFMILLTGPLMGSGGDQPSVPEKMELQYPNLGFMLNQLISHTEAGEKLPDWVPQEADVHRGQSIAVSLSLSGHAKAVAAFLEQNGGDPRHIGEDYIEAYVPVSLLGRVSQQAGVTRAGLIIPPQPLDDPEPIEGHGPGVHESQVWNDIGITGQGIKVGIIDRGFESFSSLMGAELPMTVEARCYTDIGRSSTDPLNCERNGSHGTIVSEAVIDIAPDVSLYISNPISLGDLHEAVEWMVLNEVSVINQSLTWPFDGPGDGTSEQSNSPLNAVDRAVEGGILWVNSAGNQAQNTWYGIYSDVDGDGFIEWSGNEELNSVNTGGGSCNITTAQLRWEDDWGEADTDLDLLVYNSSGSVAASSEDTQNGEEGDIPYEYLRGEIGDGYSAAVIHRDGPPPAWIQLMIWSNATGPALQYYTLRGSMGSPAESNNPGMLAVGAAPWYDTHTIERYSSRGPAPDGRIKPDIVGADCGETALIPLNEHDSGFCGTSQSAPHVAGMSALIRQRFPIYTPEETADYMRNEARQRGTPDPNNTWGFGFFVLPSPYIEPPRGCTERLDENSSVSETWDHHCPSQQRRNSYAYYYTFELTETSVVTVSLQSTEADSYLYLRSGTVEFGEAINNHQADEDALGWPDAMMWETLPAGTYTIEATTYKPYQAGDFTLTIDGL